MMLQVELHVITRMAAVCVCTRTFLRPDVTPSPLLSAANKSPAIETVTLMVRIDANHAHLTLPPGGQQLCHPSRSQEEVQGGGGLEEEAQRRWVHWRLRWSWSWWRS
jgi:hypothetical protein